jgi:thiamine biosynthesis lipoprotein
MRNILILMWLSALVLSAAPLARFEAVEPHMGTLVQIRLYARGAVAAQRAFENAFRRVRELDEKLSDYRPESELMRLCRAKAGTAVAVSGDLWRVLDQSQEIAQATNGAFDVAMGPLIALWREARKAARLPDASAIEEARRRSGYSYLHMDRGKRTVTLLREGMLLDLGGIAKGYAASEAVRVLRESGVPRALVAVSGDIAVGDPPPHREGWIIQAGKSTCTLRNAAVSTSGDAEQFVEIDGVRYSHIVDPVTGLGLRNSEEVSVTAPNGAIADALATACSVRACTPELLARFRARQLSPDVGASNPAGGKY